MAKSYNRRFRKNGLSFMVQDTHPADRKTDTDKYYLTVNQNGIYKIVYDNITVSYTHLTLPTNSLV